MAERPAAATRTAPLLWTVRLGLVLLCFVQRWGETTFDTKFDLSADPGRFMARSLHLWNQQSSFGELQNQAYGYLFPQGLFAFVGEQAGLPAWVVQRLWMALVLLAAFEGARRLWLALRPEAPVWTAVVTGLAFATAPRLLGLSGVLSAEVLPTAILPWVVLPLVLAQRGRIGLRAGGLLSGAAVLLMGGVNAVENLAALPLPLFLVLATVRRPGGRRLALWWAGATAAASAWWMLPLLVLGRYSPPFLDYIETSAAVTRPLGWANVTRGADHWLSFIYVGAEPWWPGSYALATQPLLMALTAVVAGVGVAGLCRRDLPLRTPLVLSALLGLVCLTMARPGALASPLQGFAQYLLDDPLSMLRNVHKVDPLVRLPLALGLGHLVTGLALGRVKRPAVRRWLAVAVVVAAVAGSAQPLYAGTLRKAGWTAVPSYWRQAAAYLGTHADGRATLVLPGSGFGQQTWGWTIDEPIQGLAESPWITRSQVPLTPGPTIRFLDSIEERDDDGLGSTKLADVLARAGIRYVLVRRDLDRSVSGAPTTSRVDKSLGRSALEHVASFGRSRLLDQPMIDVYRVERTVPRAEATPETDFRTLVGGPDDVLTAMEAGAVRADEPVLIRPTHAGREAPAPDVVGDGYRLRERQFGRVHDSVSQVMAPTESFRIKRAANDYPGTPGVERVSAQYEGLRSVSASTSAGYVDTLGGSEPERGPYAAVDGRLDTYWQSSPFTQANQQWVEFRLAKPTAVDHVDVILGVDGVSGTPVRQVRVSAGGQSHSYRVDPATGQVTARFNGSEVTRVRVSVTRAVVPDAPVAIRDISVPGVRFSRVLRIPDAGTDAHTTFVLRARPHRRACVETPIGPSCAVDQGRTSEEEGGLLRSLTVHQGGTWTISGSVVATPGRAAIRLLQPLFGQVAVEASSVFLDEPGVAGQLAYDGDIGTAWLSDPEDAHPTLRLHWRRPARIDRLRLVGAGGSAATPQGAVVTVGGTQQHVDLGPTGLGFLSAPVRTRSMTIAFDAPTDARGRTRQVGVAELHLRGLGNQQYRPQRSSPTGAACGLGPEVVVDGKVHRTQVLGTFGDVLDGGPLRLRGCSGPLRLAPGAHKLVVPSTFQFQPTALTLRPTSSPRPPRLPDRSIHVRSWTTAHRVVEVGSGPAAVLRIPENRNAGWVATLDGQTLEPTTVDGWQQGFQLPAGAGGRVDLRFTPDRPYRLGLLLGGLLGLTLLVAAFVVRRRERVAPPLLVTSGARPWSPRRAGVLGVLAIVASWVLGGIAVGAGVVLGLVARRVLVPAARLAGPFVAAAGIAAGIATAVHGGLPPVWTDVIAALGVGLLVAALLEAAPEETTDE